MSEIMAGIGQKIRFYRKRRGLTLDELAEMVCKSKSTLSKYEKGAIVVDVETLYDLARAFRVRVEQLLYEEPAEIVPDGDGGPAFFDGVSQFYSYLYDGRSRAVMRSVFDILDREPGGGSRIMMYMNYRDFDAYRNCETTYAGTIEHFDAVTNINLVNRDSPMERASAQILASYLDADVKWGLWNGLSSRPVMPVAAKMLFTRHLLPEGDELFEELRISKEDIRLLRVYNMFPVV